MSSDAPQPHFIQFHQEDPLAARAELLAGLQLSPARVAPKFLYDALGSRLFDAITELAEYYPRPRSWRRTALRLRVLSPRARC